MSQRQRNLLWFDELTYMDSKSSVQSKEAAELENVNCGLDRSLLLVA